MKPQSLFKGGKTDSTKTPFVPPVAERKRDRSAQRKHEQGKQAAKAAAIAKDAGKTPEPKVLGLQPLLKLEVQEPAKRTVGFCGRIVLEAPKKLAVIYSQRILVLGQ